MQDSLGTQTIFYYTDKYSHALIVLILFHFEMSHVICLHDFLLLCLHLHRKTTCTDFEKSHRICKVGFVIERAPGSCDTPDFPMSDCPKKQMIYEVSQRMDLKRNHGRLLQSSTLFRQTWRANCDVQVLIYDGDPDYPFPAYTAKATDHIVGYACKGNRRLTEERQQMTQLILHAHDKFGSVTYVQRVARPILNKTVRDKMIAKQEAMVHLGQLSLFECSESIETHSISGYYRLGSNGNQAALLHRYAKRPSSYLHLSLHDFFFEEKTMPEKKLHTTFCWCKILNLYIHQQRHMSEPCFLLIIPGLGNSHTKKMPALINFLNC